MISIIIPTYNCANFIEDAVSSILNQTYSNYEIIIVDDGSTDNTSQVLKIFNGKLKYYSNSHHGISYSRNFGIEKATGDYIAFLDADDKWKPSKLEYQISIFDNYPGVDVIFSDFDIYDSKGIITEVGGIKRKYGLFDNFKLDYTDIFQIPNQSMSQNKNYAQHLNFDFYWGKIFKFLFLGNFINTSSIILRRKILSPDKNFNENLITDEDYDLWMRLSKNFIFGFIDSPLCTFRIHPNQSTDIARRKVVIVNSSHIVYNNLEFAKEVINRSLLHKRLFQVNQKLILTYFENNENELARRFIYRNFKYFAYLPKNLLLLFWSFIPHKLSEMIRHYLLKLEASFLSK